jgi:diguanylate cyclase (GGDEF)-like protein
MPKKEFLESEKGDELALTGEGSQLSAALLIENEIARYAASWHADKRTAFLRFSNEIEERFEAETCFERIREIQISMICSVGFYLVTFFADLVFVPDLGFTGLFIRLFGIPIILLPVIFGSKLTGIKREALATFSGVIAVLSLAALPVMSFSPLSPFAFGTAMLGLIYGNIAVPYRFRSACVYSAVCCAVMIGEIFTHPGVRLELSWMLAVQIGISASFSLITSYRIERSARFNYLLSTRENLRLQMLAADREMLTALSNTDALTGLVNRRHFDRESAGMFSDPLNAGREVALLFIDVDHFKRYNDHYGHPAGDRCLRAVATTVAKSLRDTASIAARYGGEEFAILLPGVNQTQAEQIAERVCRDVFAKALPHDNRNDGMKFVTISVGVACGTVGDRLTIESLIENADGALYEAKRGGRNRVRFSLSEAA